MLHTLKEEGYNIDNFNIDATSFCEIDLSR